MVHSEIVNLCAYIYIYSFVNCELEPIWSLVFSLSFLGKKPRHSHAGPPAKSLRVLLLLKTDNGYAREGGSVFFSF